MRLARIAVVAATLLALGSAWHSGGHVWSRISEDHRTYAPYSTADREAYAATTFQLDEHIFDWYRRFLLRGDRFYLQVDDAHNPFVVRMYAGYDLLPAVEVADPSQATVIVSYFTDPNALAQARGIRYVTQVQNGLQPLFVSRLRLP